MDEIGHAILGPYIRARLSLVPKPDVWLRPYERRGSIQLGVEIGLGKIARRYFFFTLLPILSSLSLLRRFQRRINIPNRSAASSTLLRCFADSNPNEVCVPPSSSDLDDFVVVDDFSAGDLKDESTSPIDLLPHRLFSTDSNLIEQFTCTNALMLDG
ncbi:hypothetical protein YC2023_024042 [Brassica napus]